MPVTVGEIITAARDQHPSFDRHKHPDASVLRQLTAAHARILGRAVAVNRDPFRVPLEIPLPLADFAAGFELPRNLWVGEGRMFYAGDWNENVELPFSLIDPGLRDSFPSLAGWVVNGVLYLTGRETDWKDWMKLVIPYVPVAPSFTKMTDTITLPDEAHDCLVANIACFLALRAGVPLADFRTARVDAEDAFLREIGNRRVGQIMQVRDGFG